jgi:nucleotide-binding universal stress UspA family protein
MYHTILVTLDGSKRAEAILPHVEDLAHRYEAKVILLGVIEPESVVVTAEPVYTLLDTEMLQRRIGQVTNYLDGMCGELREKNIAAKTQITQAHHAAKRGAGEARGYKARDRGERRRT